MEDSTIVAPLLLVMDDRMIEGDLMIEVLHRGTMIDAVGCGNEEEGMMIGNEGGVIVQIGMIGDEHDIEINYRRDSVTITCSNIHCQPVTTIKYTVCYRKDVPLYWIYSVI